MRKYWWLLILPAILLLWWWVDRGAAVPEIHFSTVERATIESTVPTNGKVEPAEWAAARAEVAGVVRTIAIQRGQHVKAGQVLITLDSTAAQAELAAAIAREQQAQAESTVLAAGGKAATVANLNDSIQSARNAVQVAQRVYDSDKRLLQRQAATQLEVQKDADALTRAKLNLAAVENQKKTSVTASDQSVARANLHDAQAAVALAKHRAGLADVTAPMSGTIYEFDLRVGAYLEPGTLVAKVGNLDQVKVIVDVDEPDLGRVALNMPVSITSDTRPGRTWRGRVDKLPTEIISLGTRTVGQVSTVIDNPNHDLLPGVSVNATIISDVVKNAVSIPKAALRRLNNSDGAYKLRGRQIFWTPLKTGISDINRVQILSGLNPEDKVVDRVIDPSDVELKNGMRVKADF